MKAIDKSDDLLSQHDHLTELLYTFYKNILMFKKKVHVRMPHYIYEYFSVKLAYYLEIEHWFFLPCIILNLVAIERNGEWSYSGSDST